MSPVGLGNHQEPGSILINPVNDAGPQLAVDRRQGGVVHQGVNQRVVGVAGGRVHHHPLGLIDDEDVIVFVNNVEGDVFRLQVNFDRRFRFNHHPIPRLELVLGFDGLAVNGHGAIIDPALELGAGELEKVVA